MKTDLFQSCGHCWVFHICWHIEWSTLTISSFRIWNSSTGNPSPPLALFILMLHKAHLTSESRMPGSRWVIMPLWLWAKWLYIHTTDSGFHDFIPLISFFHFSSFCCLVDKLFPTLCNPMDCNLPVFPVIQYLPESAQTHIHWFNDAIHLFHLLPPPHPHFFLPSIFSSIRVFSNELALCIRWPKYWSFSLSTSSSNE